MKDLYFSGENHEYYWKGQKVDCVSDVLQLIDCLHLKSIPPKYLEQASVRGTRVHEATEDFDYGLLDIDDEEWQEENADILQYVLAYQQFASDYPDMPIASEEQIFSTELQLAGTIDLVKPINGKLSIIDKKTSKTLSKLRCELQLNFYRLLWNETHANKVENLYILALNDSGCYNLTKIDTDCQKALNFKSFYDTIKGDTKL